MPFLGDWKEVGVRSTTGQRSMQVACTWRMNSSHFFTSFLTVSLEIVHIRSGSAQGRQKRQKKKKRKHFFLLQGVPDYQISAASKVSTFKGNTILFCFLKFQRQSVKQGGKH